MEEENLGYLDTNHRYRREMNMISPEIVEIPEECTSIRNSRDVYVAVNRDDLDVLKWALDHVVAPGTRVFLIHVYSPITYIPTPAARRRNLLQKYIRMCNDAKVTVETMLIESEVTAKAILELVSVLSINILVMGIKRSSSRMLRRGMGKSRLVQKSAPDFCEVILVSDGKKVVDEQKVGPEPTSQASNGQRPVMRRNGDRNFFECGCFSGKFN